MFSMVPGIVTTRFIEEEHAMIADSQRLVPKPQRPQRSFLLSALATFFLGALSLQARQTTPQYLKLPLLRQVAQVRQLKHDKAELGYPVCLRGVVTYYDREAEILSQDRKSTRLNSSHSQISYAVFCLKKKKY